VPVTRRLVTSSSDVIDDVTWLWRH